MWKLLQFIQSIPERQENAICFFRQVFPSCLEKYLISVAASAWEMQSELGCHCTQGNLSWAGEGFPCPVNAWGGVRAIALYVAYFNMCVPWRDGKCSKKYPGAITDPVMLLLLRGAVAVG